MLTQPRPTFDSLALSAVAAEVRALVGARAVRAHQPAADEVRVLLRGRRSAVLLCSIHSAHARVHLTADAGTTPRAGAFVQLLRARLEGARLADVEQPPFDRILRLHWESLGGPVTLVAELMGRNSNLVLLRDGVVLGTLRRTPPSALRPLEARRPYAPPPSGRPTPAEVSPDRVAALLGGRAPLWDAIALVIQGLSGPLGWEVAVRAGLDPLGPIPADAAAVDRLVAALREIAAVREVGAYDPALYLESGTPAAFGAIALTCFSALEREPMAMSDALDRYYAARASHGAAGQERNTMRAAVRRRLRRATRSLEHARLDLDATRDAPRLREMGELLLAYATRIPPGSATVTLPGYDGSEVEIPLDPALSPVRNAQRLFRRYAKLSAAGAAVPARIEQLAREVAHLEEAAVHVEQAGDGDLPDIRRELEGEGVLRRARGAARRSASGPRRLVTSDEFVVLVGRTSRENDAVTFEHAAPQDLWLHARGVPGSHVVLKLDGRRPTDDAVEEAAAIAAWYSAAREGGRVPVDVTERRFVHKPKGAPPGFVTYERERTLYVAPRDPGARDPGLGTR